MPHNPSANFIITKNAETNAPIWLYRINISDTPGDPGEADLYLAEYNTNVAYYETNSGVNTTRTYAAWPISHEGVSENTDGAIDSLAVSVANVSREIQAYLELRDALRGRKVTIRQVFAERLNDPEAYIEDIYYIDSASATSRAVTFSLTGQLDVLSVRVPRRMQLRNHCCWPYKGAGCWLDDGDGTYSEPTGFNTTDQSLYSGATVTDTDEPAEAEATFHPVNITKINTATDTLIVSLRCAAQESGGPDYSDLLADAPGTESYFKLATAETINGTDTGKDPDSDYYRYSIDPTNINGKAVSDEWQEFTIPLTGWTAEGAGMLFRYASYFAWIQSASDDVTIEWRNLYIRYAQPYTFTVDDEATDFCLKTLADCRRHNNQQRFGAFPSVPSRRVFRG